MPPKRTYVYILWSERLQAFYFGATNDIRNRLYRHNHGYEKYTRKGVPWELLWYTEKKDKSSAFALEKKLKNLRGSDKVHAFIKKYGGYKEI